MRLLELNLTAFGPFTDVNLDLSGGSEGFHVVYGPNEAGKSSALRGLRDLLYGIPVRSEDDFIHAKRDLRIGGIIRRSDGKELQLVRRKRSKETLLSSDGRPLGEQALIPFLAGVPQGTFCRVFGIGHETLVEGGKELLSGGGDLGESLFAAGLGKTGFRQVLQGLDSEGDALFRSKGRNQTISLALVRYQDAQRRIRELSLKEQDWRSLWTLMEDADRLVRELEESIKELRRKRTSLERRGRLIPLANRLRESLSTLDALGDVKILPQSFSEERAKTESRLRGGQETVTEAEPEIQRLEKAISELDIPEVLLEVEEAVKELNQDIGEYRKHGKDLPRRQAEKESVDAEAAAILKEIRPDLDLDHVVEIQLSPSHVKRISQMIKAHQSLLHDRKAAGKSIQEAKQEIEEARAELRALPEKRDPGNLRRLVDRARGLGDLASTREAAIEESVAIEESCRIRSKRLPGWRGSVEELAVLPAPDSMVLARFQDGFVEADRVLDGIRDDLQECVESLHGAKRRLAQLDDAGLVPLETDLVEKRQRRDEGWAYVRTAWRNGEGPDLVEAEFDAVRPLADAFRASMTVADEVSDRLRREADRVNHRASLMAEMEALSEKRVSLDTIREGTIASREALDEEWSSLWTEIGVSPGDPGTVRAWLTELHEFRQDWDRLRETLREIDRLSDQIRLMQSEVESHLEALGEKGVGEQEGFQELLNRATETVEAIRTTEERRVELEKTLGKMDRARDRKNNEDAEASKGLKAWTIEWIEVLEKVGLSSETRISEVEDQVRGLERLFALVDNSEKLRGRIDGMERDRRRFESEVETLLEQIGPGATVLPEGLDPIQKVQWLDRSVAEARKMEERRVNWTEGLDRQRVVLSRANTQVEAEKKNLDKLCQQAGSSDPSRLAEVEKRSFGAMKLQEEIGSLRQQIAAESGGGSVEGAILESEGQDPDAVEAEIHQIGTDIEELETQRTQAAKDSGTHKERLKQLEEGVPATEAADEAESALAQIRDSVLRYVPLRLAGAILRREVEAYRKLHQGPLVTRAGEIFSSLTLGAFEGLEPDWEEDDRPVLVGVRASGGRVHMEHLSDGTRDQLYLALRLASLELVLDRNETMPFVVDDVLIHFDDERTRAGLEVLGALSERTQVILFTHHRRTMELAEEALSDKVLFTQELRI